MIILKLKLSAVMILISGVAFASDTAMENHRRLRASMENGAGNTAVSPVEVTPMAAPQANAAGYDPYGDLPEATKPAAPDSDRAPSGGNQGRKTWLKRIAQGVSGVFNGLALPAMGYFAGFTVLKPYFSTLTGMLPAILTPIAGPLMFILPFLAGGIAAMIGKKIHGGINNLLYSKDPFKFRKLLPLAAGLGGLAVGIATVMTLGLAGFMAFGIAAAIASNFRGVVKSDVARSIIEGK